jgi:tetratricopeptide (TPR) repeat protein
MQAKWGVLLLLRTFTIGMFWILGALSPAFGQSLQFKLAVNRGLEWNNRHEYDRAIAEFNYAIDLDPNIAMPYGGRGNSWAAKKEWDRAIDDYTQAIRLDPNNTEGTDNYVNRALAYNAKGDSDNAIADYTESLRRNPRQYQSALNRGIAWFQKQRFDKAIGDMNRAIRIDSRSYGPFMIRAMCWQFKHDYARAIADFQRVLEINPRLPEAYQRSAWIRATCPDPKFRDGERAVTNARKACDLKPNGWQDADSLATLAAAYAEKGEFDSAIEFQQKAIELLTDPKEKKNHQIILEQLYRKGKPFWQTS